MKMSNLNNLFISIFLMIFFSCGLGSGGSGRNSGENISNQKDSTSIQIVDASGEGDYLSIEEAISSGATNIFINDGTYKINSTILIENDGVSITGESESGVKIIQTDPEKDLLIIRADNVTIKKVTLDTRTYNSQAAIVEAGANHLMLEQSTILGGTKIFALFLPASSKSNR